MCAGGAEEAVDDYVPPFLRAGATVYRVTQIRARDLRDLRDQETERKR